MKLIDFLEIVDFRDYWEDAIYDSKVVKINYSEENKGYDKDKFFKFGIYDFGSDKYKTENIKEVLQSDILNSEVENVCVDEDSIDTLLINIAYKKQNLELCQNEKVAEDTNSGIKWIYVCSPYSGDTEENIKRAKQYCKTIAWGCGGIPIAPHLYFTQFLDDNDNIERQIGLDFGKRMIPHCNEMWVFDKKNGISVGMNEEILIAKSLNIPIKFESKFEGAEETMYRI